MILASSELIPSASVFSAIREVNTDVITSIDLKQLRAILPILARMSLCAPLDSGPKWLAKRKLIQRKLAGIECVNNLVSLLAVDFHALEIDVKKEQQLRVKMGNQSGDSILISNLTDGLALEFERSDGIRRLRLLLSELFLIMANIRSNMGYSFKNGLRPSELFDNDVYLDDICDVLCVALIELPNSLQLIDVVETLLYVKNGAIFICRIVANLPETFQEICMALLNNGEKFDEESLFGRTRLQTLRYLCQMNPVETLVVRAEAVELCRMPGLAILLSLDYCRNSEQENLASTDIVSFISGILLGNDDKSRNWISQYVRIGQKKMDSGTPTSLSVLRSELLTILNNLIKTGLQESEIDGHIVQACALIKLYCALRTVASMKFTDDETNSLLNLMVCHPPPTPTGIRFVSLGLCMLLSCSSLITNADNERKAIEWIRWLVKQESYFGRVTNVRASFGELLLLIAIHFHGNQITAIGDLVSSTLGMKIQIRINSLTRMKAIFTQEIFTDQMVTAHAVKVPVTPNLNSSVSGFLSVHCIYQLLRSRAFTKHKVPIKDWIFNQISNASAPLHPILPPLIEAFVSSIIIPSSKTISHTTNEPISEEEILKLFKYKVYSVEGNVSENSDKNKVPSVLTSQLLLLYYVLLYEDVRLHNMKTIILTDRKVKKYPPEFIAHFPVFYLIQEARRDQQNYGVLFPHLLRLVSLHYPHLCLVPDWLISEEAPNEKFSSDYKIADFEKHLLLAFDSIKKNPSHIISVLNRLLTLPRKYLWPLAPTFVSKLPSLLAEGIDRDILVKAKKVWWKLNSIFPRNLWVMTVNALKPHVDFFFKNIHQLGWNDLVLDPLHVLRCDEAVFRNVEMMEIILHILSAFLAASRIFLSHHLLERPSRSNEEEKDREELRLALVSSQESAAIQILLECCLQNQEAEKDNASLSGVPALICTHLHQIFILDPGMAKLVHFQGYPSELLPLTVSSIPSMHICLDFIPELLSQPSLKKQVSSFKILSYTKLILKFYLFLGFRH